MKIKYFFTVRRIRRTTGLLTFFMFFAILFSFTGCLAHQNQETDTINSKTKIVSADNKDNQIKTLFSNDKQDEPASRFTCHELIEPASRFSFHELKIQNEFSEISPTGKADDITNKIEPTVRITPSPTKVVKADKKDKKISITLLAAGDNLIHTQIIKSGRKPGGALNYDHLYAKIKNKISKADIAIVNQETILGGTSFAYSGYPTFNSPTQIGDALINTGFDVVLHATNHTMDKGLKGVENTYSYWSKHPKIKVVGINMTKKQSDQIPIIEKKGIKIALLNYTYGLNGFRNPQNKPYLVNMLDKNKIKEDVKRAKRKADFIIVFPHWGTEYVYEPSSQQKEMTKFLYNLGVDLVIGSHPHVLEPVKWIKYKKNHKMLVYYSLGNFISYQTEAPRMLGGMAEVTITKDKKGIYISKAGITPIVTHYENGFSNYHYGIYELSKYNKNLAIAHSVSDMSTQGPLTYQGIYDLAKKILGSWFKIR